MGRSVSICFRFSGHGPLRGLFYVSLIVLIMTVAHRPALAEPPRLWDPGYRAVIPDLSGIQRLRFLTSLDFPPFNFADATRRPTGFNVDLARAICAHLALTDRCEIEALPWEELEPALEAGNGDVILAGTAPSKEKRARFGLSEPYFRFPARFVARRDAQWGSSRFDEALRGKRVGVVANSAHAAMLASHFPQALAVDRADVADVYRGIKDGDLDFLFGDGVTLSFWLASPAAADCCAFVSGPYMSTAFVGRGMVAVTRRADTVLLDAVNGALKALEDNGTYAEIYARYFPIDPYGP